MEGTVQNFEGSGEHRGGDGRANLQLRNGENRAGDERRR